jgi:hypothetical protein
MRSLTSPVPAGVPSLFHNSWPVAGSVAVKNSVPLTSQKLSSVALKEVNGLSSVVPAAVPSVLHSPRVGWLATK